MGVAYINSWIPNVKRKLKSLYFVVNAENKIPIPNPIIAIKKIKNGNKRSVRFGLIWAPLYAMLYPTIKANKRSWINSLIKLEITIEIGVVNLGK